MSGSAINLAKLAPPDLVEVLSFDDILAGMTSDLAARDPSFAGLLASDPAMKVLEVCAFRETLIRQRVNEAARAVMLSYARGADLDQLAAFYDVLRNVGELDDDLRVRVQMAPQAMSTTGSSGSYIFHSLSASALVKDVSARMTSPGTVEVRVLSRVGSGAADSALLAAVTASLSATNKRPLTDSVVVASAIITTYTVNASLVLYEGPDSSVVQAAALSAVTAAVAGLHRIGADVNLSALYAALHQPGVFRVDLTTPSANIVCDATHAAYCTGISLTVSGTGL